MMNPAAVIDCEKKSAAFASGRLFNYNSTYTFPVRFSRYSDGNIQFPIDVRFERDVFEASDLIEHAAFATSARSGLSRFDRKASDSEPFAERRKRRGCLFVADYRQDEFRFFCFYGDSERVGSEVVHD